MSKNIDGEKIRKKSLEVRDVRETVGIKHYKAEIIQSQIKIQKAFTLNFTNYYLLTVLNILYCQLDKKHCHFAPQCHLD